MYSIDAATGAHWRVLLEWVIARAGIDCDVIDYPPPLPLPSLWKRRDLGCVFMCGYPLMHAQPAPEVLAAVLPRRALLPSQPTYWTDLVVRADSPLLTVTDALGKKLAYTTEDSQSGYQAPRRFFASFARAAGTPRATLSRLHEALFAVAAAGELADAREALLIEGFTAVDRADYRVLI